jgi:DNA polymerase III epsilon subunit family exonuclease
VTAERSEPGSSLLVGQTLYAVDVETSGWSAAAGHSVLEIACVKIEGGRLTAEWSSLAQPKKPIDAGAREVHGIDEGMLRDAPSAPEVAAAFHAHCGDGTLVFHNAAFDLPFVQALLRTADLPPLHQPVLDTLGLARGLFGSGSNDLATLGMTLGVGEPVSHRALPDARTTARLALVLVPRWERERGVRSLAELAAASQDVVRATAKRPMMDEALSGPGMAAAARP